VDFSDKKVDMLDLEWTEFEFQIIGSSSLFENQSLDGPTVT
jgi:hypothetical protein